MVHYTESATLEKSVKFAYTVLADENIHDMKYGSKQYKR